MINRKRKEVLWICRCDCGNTTEVRSWCLRLDATRSCGCLRAEILSKPKKSSLIGARSGKLTVKEIYIKTRKDGRSDRNYLKCVCDCGNEVIAQASRIRSGYTASCGCVVRTMKPRPAKYPEWVAVLHMYKKGSKDRGIAWELPDIFAKSLFQSDCFYCGQAPCRKLRSRSKKSEFLYNGIDRVSSTVGYTESNVVACCTECNYAKREMSTVEFRKLILRIHAHWASKEISQESVQESSEGLLYA